MTATKFQRVLNDRLIIGDPWTVSPEWRELFAREYQPRMCLWCDRLCKTTYRLVKTERETITVVVCENGHLLESW